MREGEPVVRRNVTKDNIVGDLFKVLPDFELGKTAKARTARAFPDILFSAPQTITGTMTAPAVMTGPFGAAGSMALTGKAGALSNIARQSAEDYILGQEFKPDTSRALTAGGLDAITQLIPAGEVAVRNIFKAKDIENLDTNKLLERLNLSQKYKVPLFGGETTQLASMKRRQQALGRAGESADLMERAYKARQTGSFRMMTQEKAQGQFLQ